MKQHARALGSLLLVCAFVLLDAGCHVADAPTSFVYALEERTVTFRRSGDRMHLAMVISAHDGTTNILETPVSWTHGFTIEKKGDADFLIESGDSGGWLFEHTGGNDWSIRSANKYIAPSGNRFAYVYWDGSPDSVCVVIVDGRAYYDSRLGNVLTSLFLSARVTNLYTCGTWHGDGRFVLESLDGIYSLSSDAMSVWTLERQRP